MSSRLFWIGVPVTAQRARALSWQTAMEVCTLGFLILWASSRTILAQATRSRGGEFGAWWNGRKRNAYWLLTWAQAQQFTMTTTRRFESSIFASIILRNRRNRLTVAARLVRLFLPRGQNPCWVSQHLPFGRGSLSKPSCMWSPPHHGLRVCGTDGKWTMYLILKAQWETQKTLICASSWITLLKWLVIPGGGHNCD